MTVIANIRTALAQRAGAASSIETTETQRRGDGNPPPADKLPLLNVQHVSTDREHATMNGTIEAASLFQLDVFTGKLAGSQIEETMDTLTQQIVDELNEETALVVAGDLDMLDHIVSDISYDLIETGDEERGHVALTVRVNYTTATQID
tara:strand:- start:628 stop:1074 length:447 start_codon:yes stop_codon:yes gene_type:complete